MAEIEHPLSFTWSEDGTHVVVSDGITSTRFHVAEEHRERRRQQIAAIIGADQTTTYNAQEGML